MKKLVMIIIGVLLISCTSACNRKGSIDDADRYDIHYIVINSTPYAQMGDGMLDYVWHQETDEYGRELFHYETGDLDVWVICQKSENKRTYFYQDFCYYICKDDAAIPDDKLLQLKERNDWNKPLDESKMTCELFKDTKKDRTYEYYLQFDQGDRVEENIRKIFGIPDTLNVHLDGIGSDPQGNAVIFAWTTVMKDGEYVVDKRYLVRYPADLEPAMIDYIEVGEELNQQEQFYAFRTKDRKTGDGSLS